MNNVLKFSIEIPKRKNACASCQKPFAPGMEFYSSLEEGPESGFLRNDHCSACWQQTPLKNFLSTWKSIVPKKIQETTFHKDRDAKAMHILKEALSYQEVDHEGEAFVLALFLARKRILYSRQDLHLEDGKKATIYEVAQTEEMLCVRKVNLSPSQIEKIQNTLAEKLKI